jgi:single-strand DNA-binding protein
MLNQAQIIGHLGKDPEVRYLPSGEAVANFSIATTEKWKDKNTGEVKEDTEWHRITMFSRLAEIAGEYLHKGSQVFVQGKIKTRKYTDKDGVERYSTEIRADVLKMLGGRQQEGERQESRPTARPAPRPTAQQRPAPAAAGSGFDDMDDDIPF